MKLHRLLAIVAIVVIDQASKTLALRVLEPGRPLELIEGIFRFTLTSNAGGAFGLFQDLGGVITVLAVLVSLGILGLLLWGPPQPRSLTAGLICIAGGALGNLIDRFLHGAVIDFLELRWGHFSWPVFNLADTVIVLGTGLVLFALLSAEHQGAHEPQ
ncbi:MAG: signal peptidase II [Candidatus Bipolaricaulota bacterium]|nr:signal peptidase II [Candidatus Bipolaricaulota bacterium]MDW8030369.1 signal peptidase II [Candidatus Bipolaricaulota bacterium]